MKIMQKVVHMPNYNYYSHTDIIHKDKGEHITSVSLFAHQQTKNIHVGLFTVHSAMYSATTKTKTYKLGL